MKLTITVIYVIFYNSILELIEVSAQPQQGCNSTADSPNPGKACIFPFTFNGQRYTGEFNFLKILKFVDVKHLLKSGCPIGKFGFPQRPREWCSTRTDRGGNHVSNQNEYGFCSNPCPLHNS